MDIDMELGRVIKEINRRKAKRVVLQFPSGLKPKAGDIADMISEKTGADIFIWLGGCFGGCDIPGGIDRFADMLIQWGHSRFYRTKGW